MWIKRNPTFFIYVDPDYATAYRQYLNYGNGRSLKEFCDNEDFDYNRLRRYATKSFWDQGMNRPNPSADGGLLIPLEIASDKDSSGNEVQNRAVEKSLKVNDVNVHLSNGLELRLHEGDIDVLFEVLHKILV